jgi:hypothetical protein
LFTMKPTLVVVSHYNAWPTDHLLTLLDELKAVPAGHPFRSRVVVNQAEDKLLELPSRFADVEVLYRENLGYNIGAWDHGWRHPSDADEFLFLQDECRIERPGWLAAYHKLLARLEIGLVGENLIWRDVRWDQLDSPDRPLDPLFRDRCFPSLYEEGRMITLAEGVLESLQHRGIPPGVTGEHLQSLILGSRRDVLEAVDGFIVGRNKAEAHVAEVAIARAVASKGFRVRQVAIRPFTYISHPQWEFLKGGKLAWFRGCVDHYLPEPMVHAMRNSVRQLKKRLKGQPANA